MAEVHVLVIGGCEGYGVHVGRVERCPWDRCPLSVSAARSEEEDDDRAENHHAGTDR